MKQPISFSVALLCVGTFAVATTPRVDPWAERESPAPSRLAVVWTSGDREVARKMVFMYTLNAKGRSWFDEVNPNRVGAFIKTPV